MTPRDFPSSFPRSEVCFVSPGKNSIEAECTKLGAAESEERPRSKHTVDSVDERVPMSSYIKPFILTSLAATTAYTSTRLYRPSPSPGLHPITSACHIPCSFAKSTTVTKFINPKGFRSWDDSRSVTLRLPQGAQGWSDEQVLARFTRGFFGGWVFGPERLALNVAGLQRKLVNFPLQGLSDLHYVV